MRAQILAKLNELATLGVHTILIGEYGSGKSHVLQRVKGAYCPTPNLGVHELSVASGIRGSLSAQLDCLLKKDAMVFVIDNFHELTPSKKELITTLAHTHTIIAAARFVPEGFKHWHTMRLIPLNVRECADLLKDYVLDASVKQTLVRKAKGNPGKLVHMARMHESLGYHRHGRKTRVLFDLSQVTNYALSLRYVFMFSHQWELYALVSFFAYALIGFRRRSRYRK
ncbi:hypothetical protein COT72_01640 [archaeon CG10_big_fil_rev_8_21_14_0_10_43_11]|nr:MAG: hypothetical protein COT72_01640 [archaeon CG10_big_fil_rev_8_21_14_0_10_43_11]